MNQLSPKQIANLRRRIDRYYLIKADLGVTCRAAIVAILLYCLVAIPLAPFSFILITAWLVMRVIVLCRRVRRAQRMEMLLAHPRLPDAIADVREASDQYVEIARHEIGPGGRAVLLAPSYEKGHIERWQAAVNECSSIH
jgi:hypothetical protein